MRQTDATGALTIIENNILTNLARTQFQTDNKSLR